jgi:cytochrome c oxidase assembly factor CtaG
VTTAHLLAIAWDPEPSVFAGCALLMLGYLAVVRFRMDSKTALFASGVTLLLLTLVGPLDFLGDDYMFSAHMFEHLLLILAVPPLLLLGLPADPVRLFLRVRIVARSERALRRPLVAWLLAVGTMWAWHAPVLYNAALANENVHIVEHLSMLVTATIYWWPVFGPLPELRLPPLSAVFYIFLAASANMLLGVLLTFSPLGYYPKYMQPADGNGVFHLIRDVWGLDPKADLQLGGLIMWVFGGLVYFWTLMAVVARWYRAEESDTAAGATGRTYS